jgi:hypothetical protein
MRAERARNLATDVFLLLAYPAVLAAWVGSALAVGQTGLLVTTGGALILWPFVCLPGFAARDLIGFASLALPSAGIGLLGIVILAAHGDPSRLLLAGCAWIVMWTVGGRRIWPWWSRTVLRRQRKGSPEGDLLRAWREITPRWRQIRSGSDSIAVWNQILALEAYETDRTRPVITGIFALWDLAHAPSTTPEVFERVNGRLNEEWDRLFELPRVRMRWPSSRARNTADRPTRGTWLEYAYPAAEALVAIAPEARLREIATASARRAARAAGVATPGIEAALDQARDGMVDETVRAEIAGLEAAARRRRDELAGTAAADRTADDGAHPWQASRIALALNAVSEAIAPTLTRVTAANAVSEAIRSVTEASAEARYVELIRGIIGPEAAARATRVSNPRGSDRGNERAEAGTIPSIIGLEATSLRGLGRLALLAAASGLVGTVAQQASWQTVARLPHPAAIDGLLGVILVGMIAHAFVRAWLGRPPFLDVVAIYVAAGVSSMLVRPLFDVVSAFAVPLLGDSWGTFFADPENVAPFAPFRAVTFAVALVVGALLLRPAGPLSDRAAASIQA